MTTLANELNKNFGYSFSQSNLSRKLNSDTVKWTELRDIAMILGYNIRIAPIENWKGIKNKGALERSENMTTIL